MGLGRVAFRRPGNATLDTPFADPDAEALRGKMNELLAALRRM